MMDERLNRLRSSTRATSSLFPPWSTMLTAPGRLPSSMWRWSGRKISIPSGGGLSMNMVDQPGAETLGEIRVERALPLWSRRWGLVGKADVVEFHGDTPYPVDYKHGPRRRREHDDLQLCAQAVCLEEMTGQEVPRGAIFHATSQHRREVIFDPALRRRLQEAVVQLREILQGHTLPPAPNDKRCRQCSLKSSCLPTVVADARRMARLASALYRVEEDG